MYHVLIYKSLVLVAALILQWVTAMERAVPMDIQLQHSEGVTFNSSTFSNVEDSAVAKSDTAVKSRTSQSSMRFDDSLAPEFITSAVAEGKR
jgi:hypothetical protein